MICLRKKILVAMDGSPLSDKAAEEAIRMAAGTPSRFKSKVFGVHVLAQLSGSGDAAEIAETVESPEAAEAETPRAYTEEEVRERIFGVIEKHGSDAGVDLETAVVRGDAADELLRFAQQEEIDVIIIGSTGKGFLKKKPLGGVALKVVKNARCSVYVVR